MLVLTSKARQELADEGRQIRGRIEALGIPRMWGEAPPEILQDLRSWQKKCAKARLSAAFVFSRLGGGTRHISGAEVALLIDEALLALDPVAMVGG